MNKPRSYLYLLLTLIGLVAYMTVLSFDLKKYTDPPVIHNVSFEYDVKPILWERCSKCHNESLNINFLDYDNAVRYADRIRVRVYLSESMPPGNITGMTKTERNIMRSWIEEGRSP